jgi:hypothetical protein
VAAFRQARGRYNQQQQQQQDQPPQQPLPAANQQRAPQPASMLSSRTAVVSYGREALEGPFGPQVAKASAMRATEATAMRATEQSSSVRPVLRVEEEGEGFGGFRVGVCKSLQNCESQVS